MARTCTLRAFLFADAILPFSGLHFVSCSCSFLFLSSLNARPLVQSFCMRPGSHTQLGNNCLCPLLFLLVFVSLGICRFSPSITGMYHYSHFLFVWRRVRRTLSLPMMMFFYLVTTGWIVYNSLLLCGNPINQSINQSISCVINS